ncbi:hypothetical protein ABZP36_034003 [Zizania latifolia]
MKRQGEIEKNKLALEERKRMQAEKPAMKVAAQAEREPEKKLKKLKKAKKKGALGGGSEAEEAAESDAKSDEAVETEVKEEMKCWQLLHQLKKNRRTMPSIEVRLQRQWPDLLELPKDLYMVPVLVVYSGDATEGLYC